MTPYRLSHCLAAALFAAALLLPGASAYAQGGASPMGDILGPGGSMKVSKDGSINTRVGSDGQLEWMVARGGVEVESEQFDLKAHELTYDKLENKIVAKGTKGKRVEVRQEDIEALCDEFEYRMNDNKIVLTGSPIIQQQIKDAQGKKQPGPKISGAKITIVRNPKDGSMDLTVDPGEKEAFVTSGAPAASSPSPSRNKTPGKTAREPAKVEVDLNDLQQRQPAKSSDEGPRGPERITPRRPGRIPEPAMDEGGA